MATAQKARLSVTSTEAQHAVIYSFWKRGKRATDIHRHLSESFGEDNALSLRTVQWWCKEFREGRTTLDRDPGQGRPTDPNTDSLPRKIQDILDEDARVTVRELEDLTGAPKSTLFRTLKSMELCKLSARWVPRILTLELKQRRMEACQRNLELVDDCGGAHAFLSRLVTSDESWISHFDPETKEQSKAWMRRGSDPPLKAAKSAWKKKIMLTAFFDRSGVLTLDFLEDGATINSDRYCQSLKKLKTDYRNKRRGQSSKDILLLHDNAKPHVPKKTKEALENLGIIVIDHPPYSPDLSPCDFFLFGRLKKELRGRTFDQRDSLEDEVRRVFHLIIQRDEYTRAMENLLKRWRKCIAVHGDYVEKISADNETE